MGNRNFIDNQSLEFINAILDESSTLTIQDAKFGWSENGRAFIWFQYLNSSNETKYRKYEFAGTRGTIIRLDSDDNTNWTEYSGHASASVFGAVKLSNDPTAAGTSSDGLAPSQKAVSDVYTYAQGDQPKATASAFGKVKLSDNPNSTGAAQYGLAPSQKALNDAIKITNVSSVNRGNDVDSDLYFNVKRAGNLVQVYAAGSIKSASMSEQYANILGSLPLPAIYNGSNQQIVMPSLPVLNGSVGLQMLLWVSGGTCTLRAAIPDSSINRSFVVNFTYLAAE